MINMLRFVFCSLVNIAQCLINGKICILCTTDFLVCTNKDIILYYNNNDADLFDCIYIDIATKASRDIYYDMRIVIGNHGIIHIYIHTYIHTYIQYPLQQYFSISSSDMIFKNVAYVSRTVTVYLINAEDYYLNNRLDFKIVIQSQIPNQLINIKNRYLYYFLFIV